MDLSKVSKFLLILATASLIIRLEAPFPLNILTKPFEILWFLLVIAAFFYLIKNRNEFKNIDKKIYLALFIFLFSILFASLISQIIYGATLDKDAVLFFLRFIIVIVTFILVLIYAKKDDGFYKKIWLAFLSPLILSPFLLVSKLAYQFNIVKDGVRFSGFTAGPVIIALPLAVSTQLLFALFLNKLFKKNRLWFFYGFLTALSCALVLWTQSRGFWLGMLFGFVINALLISLTSDYKIIPRRLFISIGAAILTVIIGFSILPSNARIAAILRIFPQYYLQYKEFYASNTNKDVIRLINQAVKEKAIPQITYDQPRIKIWKDSIKNSIRNPAGLGLAKNQIFNSKKVIQASVAPHNSLLDILMWGGIGALISALYLLWRVIKNIKNKIKNNQMNFYLQGVSSALAALLAASIFESLVFAKPIWILLALALV